MNGSKFGFGRALIWTVTMLGFSYILGVEWTWQIVALCLLSSAADKIIYAGWER